MLLGCALVAEGDLWSLLAAVWSVHHRDTTYQEHALVQAVRARLTDQVIGNRLVLVGPAVLDLQLSESLCSGQCRLESINASSKVVLRLVKDLLVLQDLEDLLLSVESFLCEQERRQCLDIDVGLCSLLRQQLGALGARRLEVFDP